MIRQLPGDCMIEIVLGLGAQLLSRVLPHCFEKQVDRSALQAHALQERLVRSSIFYAFLNRSPSFGWHSRTLEGWHQRKPKIL